MVPCRKAGTRESTSKTMTNSGATTTQTDHEAVVEDIVVFGSKYVPPPKMRSANSDASQVLSRTMSSGPSASMVWILNSFSIREYSS